MGSETPAGGLTPDNPFKAKAELGGVHSLWLRGIANNHQRTMNSQKASEPKATLMTKSPHRKRISGMGSTTGNAGNAGNSGTVNKKELGGE